MVHVRRIYGRYVIHPPTRRHCGTADKRVGCHPSHSTDHEHMQGTSCNGSTRLPAAERLRRLYPNTGTVPAHSISPPCIGQRSYFNDKKFV